MSVLCRREQVTRPVGDHTLVEREGTGKQQAALAFCILIALSMKQDMAPSLSLCLSQTPAEAHGVANR